MIEIQGEWTDIREATGSELPDLTSRGWYLICVANEVDVLGAMGEVECAGGTENHCCSHGQYGTCYSKITVPSVAQSIGLKYILGRRKEDVLSEQGKELDLAQKAIATVKNQRDAEKKAVEEWQKRNADKDHKIASLNDAYYKLEQETNRWREKHKLVEKANKKFETDLGKLRKELGERTFRHILDWKEGDEQS